MQYVPTLYSSTYSDLSIAIILSPLGHALFEKLRKSNSLKNVQTKNVKNYKEFVLIPEVQIFYKESLAGGQVW